MKNNHGESEEERKNHLIICKSRLIDFNICMVVLKLKMFASQQEQKNNEYRLSVKGRTYSACFPRDVQQCRRPLVLCYEPQSDRCCTLPETQGGPPTLSVTHPALQHTSSFRHCSLISTAVSTPHLHANHTRQAEYCHLNKS